MVAAILFGLLLAALAPALLQEGNPLPLLAASWRLEVGDEALVPLDETRFMQKKGSEEPLTTHLEEAGWRFSDRLGSNIFYKQDDRDLVVNVRMFTRRYIIYELAENPTP